MRLKEGIPNGSSGANVFQTISISPLPLSKSVYPLENWYIVIGFRRYTTCAWCDAMTGALTYFHNDIIGYTLSHPPQWKLVLQTLNSILMNGIMKVCMKWIYFVPGKPHWLLFKIDYDNCLMLCRKFYQNTLHKYWCLEKKNHRNRCHSYTVQQRYVIESLSLSEWASWSADDTAIELYMSIAYVQGKVNSTISIIAW